MSSPWPGVPCTASIAASAVCRVCSPATVAFWLNTSACNIVSRLRIAGPLRTPSPTPSAVRLRCVAISAAYPGVPAFATFCETTAIRRLTLANPPVAIERAPIELMDQGLTQFH